MLASLDELVSSPVTLLYAFALSVSALGMCAEAAYSAVARRGLYSSRDTAANLAMYAGYFAINLGWAHATLRIYTAVGDRAPLQLTVGGWHVGQHGLWWEWLALFVVEDLCFYWFHRASHRVRVLWASHVTHHSSRHFNLSVAFRQTWLPFAGVVFWFPPLLVGFDPLMVMTAQLLSLFYQELLHTQVAPPLGPLEWIFNTPRHHAVHHGSNARYLDKNYGGVLIVWDRMFGTFARRSEPIRFGLTRDIGSHNPLYIALHEWAAMARDAARSASPRALLRHVFGAPEHSS